MSRTLFGCGDDIHQKPEGRQRDSFAHTTLRVARRIPLNLLIAIHRDASHETRQIRRGSDIRRLDRDMSGTQYPTEGAYKRMLP
jgi:hypothetical protein